MRIAGILLVVLYLSSCGGTAVSFDEAATKARKALAAGTLRDSEDAIRQAAESARGRNQWLTLLKLAYQHGAAAGSYEILYIVSGNALDAISGAEEIAAIHVFSCLRTGKLERAYRVAVERLESEEFEAIRSEALLRRQAAGLGIVEGVSEGAPLLDAVGTRDPQIMKNAAEIFSEPRFALDASLLFARNGNIQDAAEIAVKNASSFPLPAQLLLYDAGRYAIALQVRDNHRNISEAAFPLLGPDIFLRLGDLQGAEERYLELTSSFQARENLQQGWLPYANLTKIFLKTGRYAEAWLLISEGRKQFPDARYLRIVEIEAAASSGGRVGTERLLQEYNEKYAPDPEVAALQYRLRPSDANLLRLDSILWGKFQNDPRDRRIGINLGASTLASGDIVGLYRLLDLWDRENGPTEWSFFLRGYATYVDSRLGDSEKAFLAAWNLVPRWQTAYNLSLIRRFFGDFAGALEHLRNAENTLERVRHSAVRDKALIRTRISRLLYERGDFDAARREAQYAVDLDPSSAEADLILKLLESRPE